MTSFVARGVMPALVTPFDAEGAVDYQAFAAQVERVIAGGCSAVVPCGTTGESPTLLAEEQKQLISTAKQVAAGRVPVLAGVGNNDTLDSISLAQGAVEADVDAGMVVVPYYNKPSQEGMKRHIAAVARALDGRPVVIYNIPGRTAVNLEVDTLLQILDELPQVVGLKDASGNVLYCQEVVRRAGDRIGVLCGDDGLTLPMMAVGAQGVISVTANAFPAEVVAVVNAVLAGNWAEAQRLHFKLLPVHAAMFCEPNPQPLKAALELLGHLKTELRLPMIPASEATRQRLLATFAEYAR